MNPGNRIGLILLLVFSLSFHNCSKESEELQTKQVETTIQTIEPLSLQRAASVTTIDLEIRCRGNCGNSDGGEDQCPMIFDKENR